MAYVRVARVKIAPRVRTHIRALDRFTRKQSKKLWCLASSTNKQTQTHYRQQESYSILPLAMQKLSFAGKETMGRARVSVARPSDVEKFKMEDKPVRGSDTESLVALLAKGATHVSKAFDITTRRHADTDATATPRAASRSTNMPLLVNLRTAVESSSIGFGCPDDGQTNPGVPSSRDQVPSRVGALRIRSPNWEDSSSPVDSRTRVSTDIIHCDESSTRRASVLHQESTAQNFSKDVKVRKTAKEPNPELLTSRPQKRTSTMNHQQQDINASPTLTKRYNSYTYPTPQQSTSSIDSYCRPKSRAIAIKRTRRCAEELAASQSEESSERMYDWATWRMYNRIVDHRRGQKFGVPGPLPVAVSHVDTQQGNKVPSEANALPNRLSDLTYDGEVFELEI